METFRFFHISDLHFSSRYESWANPVSGSVTDIKLRVLKDLFKGRSLFYPSTYSKDVSIAAYEYIIQRVDQADALIVTGDLATTGSDDDLKSALNYFLGKEGVVWNPNSRTPTPLVESELNVILMPGNHDRYHGKVEECLKPGNFSYEVYFEDNWALASKQNGITVHSVGDADAIRRIGFKKNDERVVLYCIDLALRDKDDYETLPIYYLGQGRVYDDVITDVAHDMQAMTQKFGEEVLYIWAIHFLPSENVEKLKLINSSALVKAAGINNVSIIMCGHTHEQDSYPLDVNGNNVQVVCAGTVCSIEGSGENGNKFWDIEIDVDRGGLVDTRKNTMVFNKTYGFINEN